MTISPLDSLGWIATGVFACSYAFRNPSSLRKVQALAALLWIAYGAANRSAPVMVPSLIVAGLALFSALAARGRSGTERKPAS